LRELYVFEEGISEAIAYLFYIQVAKSTGNLLWI
jgi:hypothetical protein